MPIDRRGLVAEHAVQVRGILPESPLSVGNGEICFTVDVTGLQTWPERYPVADPDGGPPGTLLSTLSTWGWHSSPGGESYDLAHCTRLYQTRRGPVRYLDLSRELGAPDAGQITAEEAWLRGNPHRLDLLRMGLVVPASPAGRGSAEPAATAGPPDGTAWRAPGPDSVEAPAQRLDLWTGAIFSRLRLAGEQVTVRTMCHPRQDTIAVRITSRLLAAGKLAVRLAFPYGSSGWSNAADWTRPQAHSSVLLRGGQGWVIRRSLDGTDSYRVAVRVSAAGTLLPGGRHQVLAVSASSLLDVVVGLWPASRAGAGDGQAGFQETERASRAWWADFWSRGAAVDVTGSADRRAAELQRRIVLSQYLTAINCSGSLPPQETGLTVNSWSGRFHLEMHWWHAAHFALWGRPDLLQRSLGWYEAVLPAARQAAAGQGYAGARWPKQCGPDGRDTPSSIGPFLLWQQAHPIYLAELVLRAGPSAEALARYAGLVTESARFMADFADRTGRGFELGPPLVPAQECYARERARLANPTFELAYWAWGLRVAQRWRARLGLEPEPGWQAVADCMVRPSVRDGIYAAAGTLPGTRRRDHPSMLYAWGFVPPTALIDPDVMRSTLHSVLSGWNWASAWGWDFPAIAMTAARLGEPQAAVSALLMEEAKNRFLPSGHNRQSPSLPVYLPGNGGLLAAVALMAGGADRPAAGFPGDGSWHVEQEGLEGHNGREGLEGHSGSRRQDA